MSKFIYVSDTAQGTKEASELQVYVTNDIKYNISVSKGELVIRKTNFKGDDDIEVTQSRTTVLLK